MTRAPNVTGTAPNVGCWPRIFTASPSSAPAASVSSTPSIDSCTRRRAMKPWMMLERSSAAPARNTIAPSNSNTGCMNASPDTTAAVAMMRPIRAAQRVARTGPMRISNIARSTRPPSSGNAGTMLVTPSNKFGQARSKNSGASVNTPRPKAMAAMPMFVSGAAPAIQSSAVGFGGRSDRTAAPPSGCSRISFVSMP